MFVVRRDFELWDPHLTDDTVVERLLLRDGVHGRDSVHAPDPGRSAGRGACARRLYRQASVHVAIDVHASDPRGADRLMRTTICVIVFVALGTDGKPHPVPRWVPGTDHERLIEDYAIKMMEFRKVLERQAAGR